MSALATMRPLLLVLLLCGGAAAGPGDAFQEHCEQARILYRDGRYEEASEELRAAYAISPEPRLLLNLGHAALRRGQPAEALRHYQRYRERARALSPQAEAELARYLRLAEAARAAGPSEPAATGATPASTLPGTAPAATLPGTAPAATRTGLAPTLTPPVGTPTATAAGLEAPPSAPGPALLPSAPRPAPPAIAGTGPTSGAAAQARPRPAEGSRRLWPWLVGAGLGAAAIVLGVTLGVTRRAAPPDLPADVRDVDVAAVRF